MKSVFLGSPNEFNNGNANVHNVNNDGNLNNNNVNNTNGVRPIININADYIRSGSGTASNPYSDVPTK